MKNTKSIEKNVFNNMTIKKHNSLYLRKKHKWQLINEIWELVKHSHTNKDYQDLKDFDVKELEEILTDCKNNLI